MRKITWRLIIIYLLAAFSCDICCYGLAVRPASQSTIIKRKILAAAYRLSNIRYAESEDAKRLLEANNASCLLLSSGKYLVSEEVANDDARLLRSIIHEDIEALMQIISKEDRYKYLAIKELVIKYFPPTPENVKLYGPLPAYNQNLYVNHIVAKAFEWLSLIEDGVVFMHEAPRPEKELLMIMRPIIMANKHNYFTEEFWDLRILTG